jgi:hypothetical protein
MIKLRATKYWKFLLLFDSKHCESLSASLREGHVYENKGLRKTLGGEEVRKGWHFIPVSFIFRRASQATHRRTGK